MGHIFKLPSPILGSRVANGIPDGVQGIFRVGNSLDVFDQEFILVQDHDDRGTGTGIKKMGLPGGTIEDGETPEMAFFRETSEEIDIWLIIRYLKKFGVFTKLRDSGFTNNNHLFDVELDISLHETKTNDLGEVSKVVRLTLRDIIICTLQGKIHEGSIRLIFHFLNGNTSGSLNDPASWNGFTF